MYFNNCGHNNSINRTFIIEPTTEGAPTLSACTGVYTNEVVSCSGDTVIQLTSGATIFNTDIIPTDDGIINIGYPNLRFRELNSISGNSSVWVATNRVETPELHLGLDSSGNTRTITANNSIIQDDILLGGGF